MSTLLLRLAGPLQAWGTDSKFDIRQTGREPSKSGVIGLLAAALGVRRDDDETIRRLSSLQFGIRVEQEGTLLRDFHMVRKDEKTSYLTHRYYLSDAVFLVALESDDDALLSQLESALKRPAFPLYLGRRSCPPTLPITLGIRPSGMRQTLQDEPWQASEWQKTQWKRRNGTSCPRLRLITDAEPGMAGAALQKDLPLSFNPSDRRYLYRAVVEPGFILPAQEATEQPETTHDPMSELR